MPDSTATSRYADPTLDVLSLVSRRAKTTPDAPAIEDASRALSYRELQAAADRIGEALRQAGIDEGTLVGVCTARTTDALVAILGILSAGAAYVPVDPRYPADRIAHTLRDADVALVIGDAASAEVVAGLGLPVRLLEGDALADGPSARADTRRIPGAAYVIYTSGSTGKPKGVVVSHAALAAYAESLNERLGLVAGDRYLHTASFAFSSSVRQWALPLTAGATIVMAPREAIADARALLRFARDKRATVADLVPSYLRGAVQVLRDADAGTRRELLDNALRLMLTASEPLPAAVVRAWRDELGHAARVVNMYGQTETAGIVSTYDVPAALSGDGVVAVGEAIPGLEVVVVDDAMHPVADGEAGEIAVAGPTLGLGYVGLEDATAQRFVTPPDGALAGLRLYRTGDRGRRRADGVLEFLGRRDTQVKVRGHRVELEEVEARLAAHPDVAEAAVSARTDASGETALVAFAVGAAGTTLDGRAIRRFAAAALPDYMVPASVVEVARLPRTPNGKLDRAALPMLDAGRVALSAGFVEPSTPDEQAVAAIWQQLLGGAPVGARDDFFELGGHSLMAMRVMARLRADLQVDLPVRVLFEHPTVAGLARAVAQARGAAAAQRVALVARPHGGTHQPSDAQQRLWLLNQMDPSSAAYNLYAAIRLTGRLDESALARAVSRVVERHEALRTVFPTVDGAPQAVVRPAAPVALPVTPVADEAAMREHVARVASTPFDLATGPLFSASLLRLAADEHVLLLVMHHIVSDGWSRGVLYDEIARLYSAFAAGEPDPLPPLPVQYADYAAWQATRLSDVHLDEQAAWWKSALTGAPATSELPSRRTRPAVQTFRGATHRFAIPESLVREVRRFGAEEGASPFMVFLAAFGAVTSRYTGQDDLVIGSPTAGRADPATEGLIGFFVNTLALRLRLEDAPTFRELLRRTRDVSLGAFANQDLPFERVVEGLNLPRDLSRSPLFQLFFILQNTPPATYRPAGLTMTQVEVDLGAAKYDVTLSLVAGEHGMTGHLEYNTDLHEADAMERFAAHFVRLLEAAVATPDTKVADLPLLTAEDAHLILDAWNDTATAWPSHETVHGLFEAQARRTPDAVAIAFEDRTLTYAELDRRATQVAAYLRQQGVGRETLVGVCVERSLEMMVALLGVLKAGAAYVPLDPTYPRDRIAYMIQDSACPVVVTTKGLLPRIALAQAKPVCLDADWDAIVAAPAVARAPADPSQVAYVIYTSGSTGRPKGVMVEHRNVVNFFTGMDARIAGRKPGVWLAVTSISFDISVLELLWTLARGFTTVIQGDEHRAGTPAVQVSAKPIDLSLFYFASAAQSDARHPYHMLFEGAKFADANGFSAVWVPERHFHEFGGIYPSPAVIAGSLAAITSRIKLRTGSVVLPLHDPIRVAEDWSVVDQISGGRVELSFASGWHDRDFAFQPQNYADRRDVMFTNIDVVRALWRGDAITRTGGSGKPVEIRTWPRPVQRELPVYVTAAGSPGTYAKAGEMGCHLLTHLLGQSLEQLAGKIQAYRDAWTAAGHPGKGKVSLMMHTFVGHDPDEVRKRVYHPFREYLRTAVDLIKGLAEGRGQDMRSAAFTAEDMEALLDHAFHRYYDTSALMGTPETCVAMVEKLKGIDVDDIACLIDFGVDEQAVLEMLPLLAEVRRMANPEPVAEPRGDFSIPAQVKRYGVTHLQCTPSHAEMLAAQPEGRDALASLECLMVGGEALPPALARELAGVVGGTVLNMYGPTETCIWSSTDVVNPAVSPVSLGRPIANTEFYVVDRAGHPVPVGVPGELLIGGAGVVRGYWQRPELTAERFVAHPVRREGRVYRTGDLVRWRPDGRVEFLGRLDHQVKVRGHRIELGEIEAVLREQPGVRESVVIAREDVPGDKRLVGYVVLAAPEEGAEPRLRDALRARLPEWMVPQHVVVLEALPRTPNGKTDRKALPAPEAQAAAAAVYVPPANDLETVLAEVWQAVLRRDQVGMQDNFFDIGGHSLLTVKVQAQLRERLRRVVPITDLFRFPTIRGLAAHLGADGQGAAAAVTEVAEARAQARRDALARRRGRRGVAD
jgi:natural product biosynthesis luciferase-like monooxygenase protein/amino acid adenylation domain-containing protein